MASCILRWTCRFRSNHFYGNRSISSSATTSLPPWLMPAPVLEAGDMRRPVTAAAAAYSDEPPPYDVKAQFEFAAAVADATANFERQQQHALQLDVQQAPPHHLTTPKSSPPPPWLMLPPVSKGGDLLYRFYSLVEDRVLTFNNTRSAADQTPPPHDAKIVGSSHGWLASFDQRSQHVFLSNPISGRHIRLPRISRRYGCCVSRVILTASPDEEGCHAVAATWISSREMVTCEPRVGSEWARFHYPNYNDLYNDLAYCSSSRVFHGIAHYKLGFDSDDRITRLDYVRGDFRRCGWGIYNNSSNSNYRASILVPADYSMGDVGFLKRRCAQAAHIVCSDRFESPLIVVRFVTEPGAGAGVMERLAFPYKSVGFVALQLVEREEKERRLGVVEDLKGLAIFVGMNHTFAVAADEYAGKLKGNSIYFADVSRRKLTPPDRDWWGPKRIYGGHDIGIFDYESKTISPCYYSCEVENFAKIDPHPMWFIPSPN